MDDETSTGASPTGGDKPELEKLRSFFKSWQYPPGSEQLQSAIIHLLNELEKCTAEKSAIATQSAAAAAAAAAKPATINPVYDTDEEEVHQETNWILQERKKKKKQKEARKPPPIYVDKPAWNADGLINHKNEIQVILEINNIDLCLISETHMTDENYCKIKGYNFYHTIHPSNNARGGSGVFIKEHLKHYEDIKIQSERIQLASVTVQTKQGPITIASIYCPPGKKITEEDLTPLFTELGHKFIIGGDFNAKHTHWGSRLISTRGRTLLKEMKNHRI
ncbi:hypothetical protein WDU94_013870 [Cyamophila willieti]